MSEQLSNLATIHYGKSPSEVLEEGGSFPIIGTGGKYGQANKAMFNGPAVVIARKGSLGNPQLLMEPFWPADTTYAAIPQKDVDASWLYYNLLNFDLTKLNEATGVPSISRDWLNRIRFFNPSKEHKRKIGEILQAVDVAIEKTEALFAKYQQIKAGLMHDLFTRGVTADGKLRPPREQAPELYQETPIGWIPKEWDVGELKNWLAYLSYGFTNPMPESDEGPYMVTAADVSLGRIQYDTCRRTTRDAFDRLLTQKSRPKIGDVLLTKDGTLGRVAIVDRTDVCINQSVAVLRPKDLQHSKFIATMLSAPMWQAKMLSDAGGSAIKHIYITVIDKMLVAWPKRPDELLAISTQIENCTAKTEHEKAYLEKLRQQKLGLMHDLLSGSIRVAL